MGALLFIQKYRVETYSFSNCPLGHEEFGPASTWMGNLAALKAKLEELDYDGGGNMVVGALIDPAVIVHLTATDLRVDWLCGA